jgi:hypothetical protein
MCILCASLPTGRVDATSKLFGIRNPWQLASFVMFSLTGCENLLLIGMCCTCQRHRECPGRSSTLTLQLRALFVLAHVFLARTWNTSPGNWATAPSIGVVAAIRLSFCREVGVHSSVHTRYPYPEQFAVCHSKNQRHTNSLAPTQRLTHTHTHTRTRTQKPTHKHTHTHTHTTPTMAKPVALVQTHMTVWQVPLLLVGTWTIFGIGPCRRTSARLRETTLAPPLRFRARTLGMAMLLQQPPGSPPKTPWESS